MSNYIELQPDSLNNVIKLLINYGSVHTYYQRKLFLEKSNLTVFEGKLPLESTTEVFAHALIKECLRVGNLPPHNIAAFDLLIEQLKIELVGHPSSVDFLDSLSTFAYDFDTPSPLLQKILVSYLTKIKNRYGTTRILDRPDPIPLDDIFTDVYIWSKPQAADRFTIEQLEIAHRKGESSPERTRYEGMSVVEQYKRLFILGKPGAGKTTFMKWITGLATKEKIKGIPIFITLKEMVDDERDIMKQIIHQLSVWEIPQPATFAEAVLKGGKAIVIFDGLDEVPGEDQKQERVITNIRDFIQTYYANRYLITCRTAAVTRDFNSFTYVEIAEFTPLQIQQYIRNYFVRYPKKAERCLAEIEQPRYAKLKGLTTSPLLLSLFCLNYDQSGQFPTERIDLYEEALLALLTRWNGTRELRPKNVSPYGKMSPKRRGQLYATIAYRNFNQGSLFIKSRILAEQIESFLDTVPGITEKENDGRKVLQDMEAQHGVIVERARQIHAFSHLTFQEYYTAKYIVDNEANGTLDELMLHMMDPRWREVFLLTSSLLSQGDAFFDLFFKGLEIHVRNLAPLEQLLIYIEQRKGKYKIGSPLEIRWWNLFYILDLFRAIERIAILDQRQELASALAHTLTSNLDTSLAVVLERTRALDLVHDLALVLEDAIHLNRARELTLDRALNLAHDLKKINVSMRLDAIGVALGKTLWVAETVPIYIEMAQDSAHSLGLVEFSKGLKELRIPILDDEDNKRTEWVSFRYQVRQLFSEYWGTCWDWNLLLEHQVIPGINDYIYAFTLLIKCLNLAVVSDREGIKNRLLLPPSAAPT